MSEVGRNLHSCHPTVSPVRPQPTTPQGLGDLFAPIPWGNGQTILREALLTADHNAYHLGQMVDLRRLLGAWPD